MSTQTWFCQCRGGDSEEGRDSCDRCLEGKCRVCLSRWMRMLPFEFSNHHHSSDGFLAPPTLAEDSYALGYLGSYSIQGTGPLSETSACCLGDTAGQGPYAASDPASVCPSHTCCPVVGTRTAALHFSASPREQLSPAPAQGLRGLFLQGSPTLFNGPRPSASPAPRFPLW